MTEGAAPAILTGEADGSAGSEERGESKVFGATPIEGGLAGGHGLAVLKNFTNLMIDLKIGRNGGEGKTELGDFRSGDGGGHWVKKGGARERRMEAGLNLTDGLAGLLQSFLRDGVNLGAKLFYFFFRDNTCVEEATSEETTDGGMRIDF